MPSHTATTRYADLAGTAALEGHAARNFLDELRDRATLPPRSIPVGVAFDSMPDRNDPNFGWSVGLLVANTDEVGVSHDEFSRYARATGELHVRRIPVKLTRDEFFVLLKHLQVVAFLRPFDDVTPSVYESDESAFANPKVPPAVRRWQ